MAKRDFAALEDGTHISSTPYPHLTALRRL
jgi:hypothetical protein